MFATLFRRYFFNHSTSGSMLLIVATLAAFFLANSESSELYSAIIQFPIHEGNKISHHLDVQLIVNEGLMVVFFLAVGLEVKHALLEGALNNIERAALPVIAAVGGMLLPALIYSIVTFKKPELRVGWAIPIATDIAFTIGIISLLGNRVPSGLKAFLMTLAIVDDLGAVGIITIFYSSKINTLGLFLSSIILGIMVLMNWINVRRITPYLVLGVLLWGCAMLAGVHATLVGIIVGVLIPTRSSRKEDSPALVLERRIRPWLSYLILPLFSFVNSGITLNFLTIKHLTSLLPLGISAGLVFGKPLGIVLFTRIAVKLKLASFPTGVEFYHVAISAVLCGIGFTMSIFIANLAFKKTDYLILELAKVGTLFGSLTAAILGFLLLYILLPRIST